MNGTSKNKGFTIIELLVSITVFCVVIAVFSELFAFAFTQERNVLTSAYILNNASFAADYMSRALRMAQKDIDGSCIDAKHNYQTFSDAGYTYLNHIKFKNQYGDCEEFYLQNNAIYVKKNGSSLPLTSTSSGMRIDYLKFKVIGESQDDDYQPRVILAISMTANDFSHPVKFETMVSQRQLDVQY